MTYIAGTATRWVDDAFPGWVQVQVAEADGTLATLVDKADVFDSRGRLTPETRYPVPVELPCHVVRRERDQYDRELAIVVLLHGIEDHEGRRELRVPLDHVIGDHDS